MKFVKLSSTGRNIRYAFLAMVFILVFGTSGYMILESYSLVDAIYMAAITISTVGFGEVAKLGYSGKIFTIILIIMSLSIVAYAISQISAYFVEGQFNKFVRGYKRKSNLNKMKDHVIVVGLGRNGSQTVAELINHKHPFVVVERSQQIMMAERDNPISFVEGDATEDKTLIEAGIMRAKALISTLPVDADNTFVALTARSLNPNIQIISRASNRSSMKKLLIAGVDNVVMPETVGGDYMASMVLKPDVVEFLNLIRITGEDDNNLEEIASDDLPESMHHKSIAELGIRVRTGLSIVGFKDKEGKYTINPTPDTTIDPGSKLFVLGTHAQIMKLKSDISKGTLDV